MVQNKHSVLFVGTDSTVNIQLFGDDGRESDEMILDDGQRTVRGFRSGLAGLILIIILNSTELNLDI